VSPGAVQKSVARLIGTRYSVSTMREARAQPVGVGGATPGGNEMNERQLDIGEELGKGWALYKANMGLLIGACAITMLLSSVTCGILSGPLGAGVFLILRRVIRQDPVAPTAGDVFKGFDLFLQAFLVMLLVWVISIGVLLVLAFIPVLGQLASTLISACSGAVTMWALMFVVYERMTAVDALKRLFNGVTSGAFLTPLVMGVVACFIGGLGVVACLVGMFFTMPYAYCCLASAYETLYGDLPEVAQVVSEPDVLNVRPPDPPPQ
jgi:hypothetical protein